MYNTKAIKRNDKMRKNVSMLNLSILQRFNKKCVRLWAVGVADQCYQGGQYRMNSYLNCTAYAQGTVNALKGIQNITNKVDGIYWPKIAVLCRDMKSKEMMNKNVNILDFMKYFG